MTKMIKITKMFKITKMKKMMFKFQDMDSGDSIMISAKVIACVDEIDCAPVNIFFLQKLILEKTKATFGDIRELKGDLGSIREI
jgi:hypothetical protein